MPVAEMKRVGVSGSGSRSQELGKAKPTVGSGFLGTATQTSINLEPKIQAGSSFSGTRELIMTFYKIKDKLYSDTSVSKNAQNDFPSGFRIPKERNPKERDPDTLRNGLNC